MCTRNIHTHKPADLCGWVLLSCSYLSCLFAVMLIALNVIPFHAIFLPYLWESCVNGQASWLYYYYCLFMMIFAEVMVYGNLYLAITTCPGYVPHAIWSKAPAYEGKQYSENPFEVRQLDRYGKLRYCSRCEQFKPDNAHHCSHCNRCIYRMDHHCPWINNCVGRDNAKYFLLFLAYIPVGAFHIVFMTAYSCWAHFPQLDFTFGGSGPGLDVYPALAFMLSILFSFCMGICFGSFAAHFLYMTHRGDTSISVAVTKHTAGAAAAAADPARDPHAQMLRWEKKASHVYDLFGADQRWWRMILCFPPVRDERGLTDETMPSYADDIQKLV